jgi:predicted transcriptional regulator
MTSEKLFNIIRDSNWHSLRELAAKIGAPVTKLIEFAQLLSGQGMIIYDKDTQRIRMEPEWKVLLPDDMGTKTSDPECKAPLAEK